MKVVGGKGLCIELSVSGILSILHCSPLIFKTYSELSKVIEALRIDTVHLIDVGVSVTAEIYIILMNRSGCLAVSKSEILDIAGEKHSLPFLTIAQGEP